VPHTKEESCQAANAGWERKQAELDAATQEVVAAETKELRRIAGQYSVAELRELMEKGEAATGYQQEQFDEAMLWVREQVMKP
jgi:hypothetical protein